MPQAARTGDLNLGGPIIAGAPTVFIGGLPAARAGDGVAGPTGPGVVSAGSPTVFIEGRPASRVGNPSSAGMVATGAANVFIGNRPGAGPREGWGGGADGSGGGPGAPGNPGAAAGKPGGSTGVPGKDSGTPGAAAAIAGGSGKMAVLLGAPVSMELIQLFLAVAGGFLVDLGAKMSPGARETLAAAIGSANQVLGLKKFQFLAESLARVQNALQSAAATVPPDDLKANAEAARAAQVVKEGTTNTVAVVPGRAEFPGTPNRAKLIVSEKKSG